MTPRVLLLMPTTTYKAEDFLEAATRLGVEVVVGSDHRASLEDRSPGTTMMLDFERPERGLAGVVDVHRSRPFDAVVGTDDEATELAALVGEALGLKHNPPDAVRAARDKFAARNRFRAAGMRCPDFRSLSLDEGVGEIAHDIGYPCVVKPLRLAASRGVLRADDPASLEAAFARVAAIVREAQTPGSSGMLLVEDYIPGVEVALEGLLDGGRLEVLALFDKPDPLEGPVFEETIYVTPSRLPQGVRDDIAQEVSTACRALGLREGPVHAELRIRDGRPWMLEVAPRTIGGLCARTLRFGTGISLEELIVSHALGHDRTTAPRENRAAGVMMIPIPEAGVFAGIDGVGEARAVVGIEDVQISLHRGSEVRPLPEGHQYLGFLFARADDPAGVEAALREAHARLRIRIVSR